MKYTFFLLCMLFIACHKSTTTPIKQYPHEVSFHLQDNTNGNKRDRTYNSSQTKAWFENEPYDVFSLTDEDSLTMSVRIILMKNNNPSLNIENWIMSMNTKMRKGDMTYTNRPDPGLRYENPEAYLNDLFSTSTESPPNMSLEYYQNFQLGVSNSSDEGSQFTLDKATVGYDNTGKPYFDLEGTFAFELNLSSRSFPELTVQDGKFKFRIFPDFYCD